MNISLLPLLACPVDGLGPLVLDVKDGEGGEGGARVAAGTLTCPGCGRRYLITRGIPDLCELAGDPDETAIKQQEVSARDEEAASYELMFTGYQTAAERGAILARLALQPTHRVLEVGCGTGRITRAVAGECAELVAVDFSMHALRQLQHQLGDRPDIHLLRADANKLPFCPSACFQRIVSSQVLEHLPSPALRNAFFASSRRLLAPDGRLVLTTYNHSRQKRSAGVPKEGRHDSGVYYFCYGAAELAAALRPFFAVDEVCGVRNRLVPARVLERVGRLGPALDVLVSRTPVSRATGHLLLVRARPLAANVVVHPRRAHTVAEVFFSDHVPVGAADVAELVQSPTFQAGGRCEEFWTIAVELSGDDASLIEGFTKGARADVRRAEGDGLGYEAHRHPDGATVIAFRAFYDRLAEEKGLSRADPGRLSRLAEAGLLDLSSVIGEDGGALVWHAYVRTPERARLLLSATRPRAGSGPALRSRMGRANRWHHWRDMLRFKAEGVEVYDLGGWYEGSLDEGRLRVNAFKEEFGGERVRMYNCWRPLTRRGVLVLAARGVRKWFRSRDGA
ncbi:MAG TPA: methyltransferase domain-containing protein [Acidimicrobiales bacterium]|nr:methyltransferase domain-containing protein [Acidimicrobiales bacterium]